MVRCWIITADENRVDFSRIQNTVETLVNTYGGVHHANESLCTLLDTNTLKAHPIVSISTEFDELEKLAKSSEFLSLASKQQDPGSGDQALAEMYIKTRKEFNVISRSLSKILWDWIPNRFDEFESLRAHQLVNPGDFSIGSHFGEFLLTGEIGRGCAGTIFSCKKRGETRSLALKMMNKRKLLTTKSIIRAKSEIKLLLDQDAHVLHRKNILPILEVIHSSTCMTYAMEQFGTNLLEFSMNANEGVNVHDKNTIKVTKAICDALNYVHNLGYAHRDIKSENILVRTASGNGKHITDVRLIDFGIICRLDDESALGEMCGTPGFIAPEVITRQVEDGRKADVWSLACVVLERSVDEVWFEDNWFNPNSQLNYQNPNSSQDLSPLHVAVMMALNLLAGQNPSIFNFVAQALVLDPRQRPTIDTLTLEWMASTPTHMIQSASEGGITRGPSLPLRLSNTSPMANNSTCFPASPQQMDWRQRSNSTNRSFAREQPHSFHAPGISSFDRITQLTPLQTPQQTPQQTSHQTPLPMLSPRVLPRNPFDPEMRRS